MSTITDAPRKGQTVEIKLDRHDEPRTVRVLKAPPWTETIAGEEREHDDAMLVEYPNTTSRMPLMGDLRETVPVDSIVE